MRNKAITPEESWARREVARYEFHEAKQEFVEAMRTAFIDERGYLLFAGILVGMLIAQAAVWLGLM